MITQKGYGYARAEDDPILYHGVTKFDPAVGIAPKAGGEAGVHADLRRLAVRHGGARPRASSAITPAMREGSGLVRFSQEYPERYFDVGIAEQHAVTFAAGLACEGMKPVVAIYSTFLQRAYDQLIHDVALQNLPVVFAIDRAGHRRRRRRDAHRRVRPLVPALPAEHDGDGARRRERMPADALHGVHARHAGGGPLSARHRARRRGRGRR